MTKSRQDFIETQKSLPKKIAGERFKIREKSTRFQSVARQIKRGKVGYFEEISCQRSLKRFHFLVYVIISSY